MNIRPRESARQSLVAIALASTLASTDWRGAAATPERIAPLSALFVQSVDTAARLKDVVARFAAETKLPGLAFGAIADGKVLLREALGSTGPVDTTSPPVDRRTVFHLASLSKPVVATAIVALTERGKLSLDDPVVKHLPYFRLADDRYPQITIRQLLTHVSGLPDVTDYGWATPEHDDGALER